MPISSTLTAVLERLAKVSEWVFSSPRTGEAYTATGIRHIFNRGVAPVGLIQGEVTFQTLRHTALSRMIAAGLDGYTVIAIGGRSSTRMLARYTHPTEERKLDALEAAATVVTRWSRTVSADGVREKEASEITSSLKEFGGRRGDRTPDLCIANAALSQLS